MDITGIEVSGEVYELNDETARTNAQTATQTAESANEIATSADATATANATAIGTLTDLETTEKTNLVGAINEVDAKSSELLDLSEYLTRTTQNSTSITRQGIFLKKDGSILVRQTFSTSYSNSTIGQKILAQYTTTDQTTLATAVKEFLGEDMFNLLPSSSLQVSNGHVVYMGEPGVGDYADLSIILTVRKTSDTTLNISIDVNAFVLIVTSSGTHSGITSHVSMCESFLG